ncbi:MAG: RNA-binding protein [Gammaproteobacteria bacterium]|nr:MAG: RNA-binding protein [Gammaproteobacteria bacterium]PIE35926.1 MAG: RNA-binding protein [Gammaproteobacteria bacterium]
MTDSGSQERLRIDKWLWAARFFKTRAIATDAIRHNRVRIDGQRIKPSRSIAVGDVVTIDKPPYSFEVTVLGLDDRRRPAREAVLLYEESAESRARREALATNLRADRMASRGLAGAGRPNKRQRRQIIRFQNQNDEN